MNASSNHDEAHHPLPSEPKSSIDTSVSMLQQSILSMSVSDAGSSSVGPSFVDRSSSTGTWSNMEYRHEIQEIERLIEAGDAAALDAYLQRTESDSLSRAQLETRLVRSSPSAVAEDVEESDSCDWMKRSILSPYIVTITNAPLSCAPTCTVQPIATSGTVLYIFGEQCHHAHFTTLCKRMHMRVARATYQSERERYHALFLEAVREQGGVFLAPTHNEWREVPLHELVSTVWTFVQQPCYMDWDPSRDVAGRGGAAARYRGHQRYLFQRDQWGATYTDAATDDAMKKVIATQLVQWVYRTGGHFVRKCSVQTEYYYIQDDKSAIKKAMQALSEYKRVTGE